MKVEMVSGRLVGLLALGLIPTMGLLTLITEFVPVARADLGTPSDVKMIPWVELNLIWGDPNDANEPDTQRVVDGLVFWAGVTDTAVVTTGDGKAKVYKTLYDALDARGVTDLRIIPGIKPCYLAADGCTFNDPNFWPLVADEVEAIEDVYDQDINQPMPDFYLENLELTCCYYTYGTCDDSTDSYWYPNGCDCDPNFPGDPNLDGLATGLGWLPNNIVYHWHPGVTRGNAAYRERQATIVEAVVRGLGDQNVRFTNTRLASQGAVTSQGAEDAYERLLEITNQPTEPLMWFMNCLDAYGNSYWYSNQINGVLCHASRCYGFEEALIYPGHKCFDVISEEIVDPNNYDGSSDCCPDLDCDGSVGMYEQQLVLAAYGTCKGDPDYNEDADLYVDNCIDMNDLSVILSNSGDCWPESPDPEPNCPYCQ